MIEVMNLGWRDDPALSTWAQKAKDFLWLVIEERLRSGVPGLGEQLLALGFRSPLARTAQAPGG